MSEWGRRTRGGMLWAIATFAGGRFFTFVAAAVLARLLTPDDFGVVAATLVYLAALELLGDLGMKATVVFEQEEGISRRLDTAFTVNLLIAVVLTTLGVVFAPAVADFFRLEDADHLFRLASISLVITALGNIHDSVLLRDLDFRKRAIPLIVRAAVRGVLSIGLAIAGLKADALVIGMLAGSVVFTVLQWHLTKFRPRLTIDRSVLGSMAGYGSGQALLGIVAFIGTRLDIVIVGRVLGERALGLYSVAFRIPELVLESIAWQVSLVAFPALARQRAADELGLNGATLAIVRYQALYSLPMAVGCAVLAEPLIVTLFSDTWAPAAAVLVPVSLMLGLYTSSLPMGETFRAIGRQRWLVVLALVQLPLLVVALLIASDHGIATVAWARAGAVAIHSVLTFALVMAVRRISVGDVARTLGPGAAAAFGVAAGAGAVRLAWPDPSLLPLLAGTAAGTAGAVLALRVLAPTTLRQLRGQAADMLPSRRSAPVS